MGYTHYLKQSKQVQTNTWQQIQDDSIIMLEEINKKFPHIKLVNNEPGIYIVNKDYISFNDTNNPHEDFYLSRNEVGFNFCKTARKPYDIAVCSILLIANHYASDCYNITSDGNSQDWEDAVNLNAIVLGHAFKLPAGVHDQYSETIQTNAQSLAKKLQNKSQEHGQRFKF